MRRRLLVPGLLAAAAVAGIVVAPARLAGWLIPREALVADGYAGTLWAGHAARALVATPAGFFHLGRVEWRLQPLSLLTLRPRLALSATWADQRFSGEVRWLGGDRVGLRDARFSARAALLRQLAPVAVSGRVSARVDEAVLAAGVPRRLRGRLVWEDAAWETVDTGFALGSYAVDFAPAGGRVDGEVVTLAGPLEAGGSIALDGERYRVDLTLGSRRPLAPPLANALSLLATPTGAGYRLRVDGEL